MNAFCLNNENAVELALEEHDRAMDEIQDSLQPNILFDQIGNKLDDEDHCDQ